MARVASLDFFDEVLLVVAISIISANITPEHYYHSTVGTLVETDFTMTLFMEGFDLMILDSKLLPLPPCWLLLSFLVSSYTLY